MLLKLCEHRLALCKKLPVVRLPSNERKAGDPVNHVARQFLSAVPNGRFLSRLQGGDGVRTSAHHPSLTTIASAIPNDGVAPMIGRIRIRSGSHRFSALVGGARPRRFPSPPASTASNLAMRRRAPSGGRSTGHRGAAPARSIALINGLRGPPAITVAA